MFLYVTSPDAVVTRRGERLEILRDSQRIGSAPVLDLEGVILWGSNITAPAMKLLLDRGIRTILLDKNGRYRGQIEGAYNSNVPLRKRIYTMNESGSVGVARRLVEAKLLNEATVLDKWARRGLHAVRPFIARLRSAAAEALEAESLESLRGVEGAATREYYRAASLGIPDGFERSKRPPRDLINACLSTGYMLLQQRCMAAALAAGFDLYVGLYHSHKPGKPALALDLMEPFRPVIDRAIFGAARRRELKEEFEDRKSEGVYLNPVGLEFVIQRVNDVFCKTAHYQGKRWELNAIPFEMARSLARAVLEKGEFDAYVMERV